MTDYFKVKNWENFQHYKDRNPPWIKLHNQLLDNYEFELLGDSSKGHLLCIWMLASRTQNKMPYDARWIGKKIGASSKVDLQALENSGFIECLHDASKMLHKQNNPDSVSVPLEEKSRVETEESINPLSSKPDLVMEIFSYWCNVMKKQPSTTKLTPKRMKAIKARLKDYKIDDIKRAITNCSNDAFSMGKNDRQKKFNDIELICRSGEKLESFFDSSKVESESAMNKRIGLEWANEENNV